MESKVEAIALTSSGVDLRYSPEERTGVIIVESFPELGKLAALRFIEWVQNNPGGVISLPTGKTPEYFIKEVGRYLKNWSKKEIKKELEEGGVDAGKMPDMESFHFVQIDEFYPINPLYHNSFYYYVNKFYIKGFGLDPRKALLIDCSKIGLPKDMDLDDIWPDGEVDLSLRHRAPRTKTEHTRKKALESIDQWCSEYEQKVRSLGGIGFFLGGIGPDGHIGFNIRGSDLFSTTRLTPTNYETQAAAAQDLGGIETARKRLVITIGLATIIHNQSCVAIIIAAGEAKAKIVADSIQSPQHIHYPSTILHSLPNSRFYLTKGAAKLLTRRQILNIQKLTQIDNEIIEKVVIDIACRKKTQITQLNRNDFIHYPLAKTLLDKTKGDIGTLKKRVIDSLTKKIEDGSDVYTNRIFLHTEPHHDDIMLGYLPAVVRHIRERTTSHFFATFTSGFTAVTNIFMLEQLKKLRKYVQLGVLSELVEEGYFDPSNTVGKNRDVLQYLDGVAANSEAMKDEGLMRRLLRNLVALYEENDIEQLNHRIDELINYFKTQYPGKKDSPHIQKLKGMIREWEADCLWGYFGWHTDSIFHLRLGFYTGDIFTEEPEIQRDVLPILNLLKRINPDIITIALDPESSGPDTHYKVLQAITEALTLYEKESGKKDIQIWGYRNVWYRFHPSEANLFIPVSLNMFALQDSAFMNSFLSQRTASFPSYEHDGPFSELAQEIQVQQYQMLKTCLGRGYFYEHKSALVRATRGMVFIKSMDLDELYQHSRELRKRTENI
ncbi:MAG: glucosamine-6-phosphate deaminase [Spirochaetota bacterium]|nr:MAG: glucosamine-6-phosphate deaminase [Spirochaetota bacterium]